MEHATPEQLEAGRIWQKKRAEERNALKKIELEKKINELKSELILTVVKDLDIDSMIDTAQQIILKHRVRLADKDLVEICNVYFDRNKTQERLTESDRLYLEMDHVSNMIVDGNGVGIYYQ